MERSHAARVLGIDVTATPDQVRDAFRRRARQVHPDTSGGDVAQMVELNAAYETLTARAGPDWELVVAPDPAESWSDPWIDDTNLGDAGSSGGDLRLLRFFGVALAVIGIVMTAIVFIAAIGYDWSVSP